MPSSRTVLITGALTAAALASATALAAGVDPTPTLRSTPQLLILDAHHAKLSFDSGRIARTSSGRIDATIAFAGGARVSGLKVNRDPDLLAPYVAAVSSSRVMRHDERFRVTFRLGDSTPRTRTLAGRSITKPELGGAPQMRIVDEHHATLGFASDELPRTSAGKLDATIVFANGETVSGLKRTGRHGYDATYGAAISSPRVMTDHERFTVTFALGNSKPVLRTVTLYQPGAHT
jgi:hypothetical protein